MDPGPPDKRVIAQMNHELDIIHDTSAEGMFTLAKQSKTSRGWFKGFSKLAIAKAHQLHDRDLKALNTAKKPDRIKPLPLRDVRIQDGGFRALLRPASWNVIRLKVGN